MNQFDGTYVYTSGRLHCDQERWIFVNFSGYNGFLLITAGHGSCHSHRTLAGSYIIFADQLFCIVPDLFFLQETKFIGKLRFKISLEYHVILKGIIQNQTMFMSVLRNMALSENRSLDVQKPL